MKQTHLIFFLSGIILFAFTMSCVAQSKTEDIIYLKNGSVIHGVILEMIPNQSVKIQTADHNLFIFKTEDVEKITKGPAEYYKRDNGGGYVNSPDIGYVLGIGDGSMDVQGQTIASHKNDYHAISIRDFNGFRVSQDLLIGGGIGYEYYSGDPAYLPATEYIPIFFGVRGYAKSRSNTQVGFVLDIGYEIGMTEKTGSDNSLGPGFAITVTDKYKGAFFVNPAISSRTMMGEKSAMCVSFGYQYQNVSIDETAVITTTYPGLGSYTQNLAGSATLRSSFLTFRLAFEF